MVFLFDFVGFNLTFLVVNKLFIVMESESTSKDPPLPVADLKDFKWTPTLEKTLLFNMINLKPSGINKHLCMLLIRDKISKELKVNIPSKCIWQYLDSKWDLEAADSIENATLDTIEKNFDLPEEYKQLISEEEQIKEMQENDGVNDGINKIKLLDDPNKTKLKSVSLIDSKDSLNETDPSSTKVSEVELEEIPSIRRSLRTNDKPEEKELQDSTKKTNKLSRLSNKIDVKKVTDLKQPNKNIQNQSKDSEKNNIVLNMKNRKRKSRNVSESSFSSDNSKQPRNLKNNLTDINISDSSSRSVTPEMLRGKTSNRSVTPETMSRKTNLRSSDKDQKLNVSLEKGSTKFGHYDITLPEVRLERLKTEKVEKPVMELKSKSLIQSKNELKQGKSKFRGRLTSDLLVAQQSPVIQPLGRRSCSNKSL